MMRVRFHPEADREVAGHEAWYRERSEVAAQGFLLELNSAITTVAEFPEQWPNRDAVNDDTSFLATRSSFFIE
ncbi:MAG: type II toxin-antitoxin system RelE/ParE family toxin [Acidobacteriota bacterium]|nr:type II toxin-antitoxin system RelE/ParE family toxin [Acidobacteriota bacterium]